MFQRNQLLILIKRMQEPRRFLQVIMGPRQVGKTTLLTQLTARVKIDYHFVSADSVAASNATWLEQQWEAARIKLALSEKKRIFISN
jgi:predicted AAA+ superfamily ATPase